ncbi:sugar kinase [Enterococcus raffinosus]|uniref:Sugar kinase n=1 Tax=Enterococcus raffinosus TaxID=71452 RepID=A0AAW8T9U5_9ENTE|nr:sugar kinase [Enterococcus raffinosus]MDT2524713.1 sugar kinase [Enterococcus raffinosus]MDT2528515.1 sugar kinase [Enterococcus raffinosus]MDT2535430.1 sugar kinase [Enterococcus raffinosus]MDT2545733.1 sugar kinase [Enterococcus raffinosus]MDT2553572.1 sugar kinase [Enterococcus raffinosus]
MAKIVCLGEIMLRLSVETGIRLNHTQQLEAYYGGGEANVAVSLANYGHQVQFASKIADNGLGQAAERHLRSYGVATDYLLKAQGRMGVYYVEQGNAQRATSVIYDRQYSTFSLMSELEWKLQDLFSDVEIFHISGITPALSEYWKELTIELTKTAKKTGCKVSFDCNYRQSLWSQGEAGAFLKKVLPLVDYCSAGKMDAIYLLGVPETEEDIVYYYQKMQELFPNITAFYSTNRSVHSTCVHELQGTLWLNGKCYTSKNHLIDPIVDRIGGGDAFTGGILHGLINDYLPIETIEFATGASVLKHSVKGDCNQFTEEEVVSFIQSSTATIKR